MIEGPQDDSRYLMTCTEDVVSTLVQQSLPHEIKRTFEGALAERMFCHTNALFVHTLAVGSTHKLYIHTYAYYSFQTISV